MNQLRAQKQRVVPSTRLERYTRHFLLMTLTALSATELRIIGSLINSRIRDLAQLLEQVDHVRGTRICRVPEE
ncbi:unnamed protein product [Echinostoma caproni]|uniref:MarR family transcriptional regulator n=1 Tax=Echinostoma caproni TaxID=27848 RepID=A0A183AWA1_9TREM|nr:unnamed protein product [Echinostoma caproni]